MNFFRNQRLAHRQTLVFLLLFMFTVTLVVGLSTTLVWLGCMVISPKNAPAFVFYTALIVVIAIAGAWTVRSMELRSGGGAAIARHLGGEPVPSSSSIPDIQRYRNIAQEMAIASRTPMPKLYWLPRETAINAFVAGFTHADATLVVTRGALEQLNRDELQAVIAHEFSHLLNGDMRLNTQVSSWLFGIYAVYISGISVLNLTHFAPDVDREERPLRIFTFPLVVLFGGVLASIGYIGKLCGRLLQAAISRQREYLADASAVQFTRQKLGLANALKKIYFDSSLLRNPQTETYNHFFLSEAVIASRLFATHPPLVERIRALDPAFNPDEDPQSALGNLLDVDALHQALPLHFAANTSSFSNRSEAVFTVRDGLAWLFANLLCAENEAMRQEQLKMIENDWDNDIAFLSRTMEPDVHSQDNYLRLTRLRLILVHLHTLSSTQQQTLRRTLCSLIASDNNISFLEVTIAHLVDEYLHDMALPGRVKVTGCLRLDDCAKETDLLQRMVVNNAKEAPAHIVISPIDHTGKAATENVDAFRQAIDSLNLLTFDEKKNLFQTLYDACGRPSHEQQEILSLLAACLHAPPLDALVYYPGSDLTLA